MKISVIVPTNNIERINNFIDRYNNLFFFKTIASLIIVGNGEVEKEDIPVLPNLHFIRYQKSFTIVPFAELRGIGMNLLDTDYFLFLDDDHIFNNKSDMFLIKCLDFLLCHNDCGVLQLEKEDFTKTGFYIKKNAHIWTSRGLFIKNVGFDYNKLYKFSGACEDLLYGYEALNKGYLPYCIWNSTITRGCNLPNNYKELYNKSYNETLLDYNIIGYIRKKYNQERWKFYGNLDHLSYPNNLRIKIKNTLSNLI